TVRLLQLFSVMILFLVNACKETDGFNLPASSDISKPEVVTNVKVDNFNGGSYITYTLPNSSNLLYVLAKYSIRDRVLLETKSSYYSDSITVDGFAESKEYDVTLYSVSRANVMSDPVTVKVHPETPYYKLIKPSVSTTADFGGINIAALNPSRQPVGMILLALDSTTSSLEIQDQHYTNTDTINYSVRGYAPKPRKFGVYVADRFGNNSDTSIVTITPLPEALLNKSKFFNYRLASDGDLYTDGGWGVERLWDGNVGEPGWHTVASSKGMHAVVKFGLGVSAKLSRFILWNIPNEYSYSHGNAKVFSLWGSDKAAPQDIKLPKTAAVGTVLGDWVNLGNYNFPNPPSGLAAGAANATDRAFVAAGVNFNIPISSPKVRFLRYSVSQSWSGGEFAHAMEISVYGNSL
ncbi:MAG: hypothetical protein JWQ25_3272, partial [Daejeonella sp.]|nr:hypothetical protein [Daejeonella sp.]